MERGLQGAWWLVLALVGCPAGEEGGEPVSDAELAHLEEIGELFPVGVLDPDAEAAARADEQAAAEAVITDFLADRPDLAEQLLWEPDPSVTVRADGALEVPLGDRTVVLDAPIWDRLSVARHIERLADPATNLARLAELYPIVPEYCRSLVAPEAVWGQLDLGELQDAQSTLAQCFDEWRSFSRPFADDLVPGGARRPALPADAAADGCGFAVLAGDGNDGADQVCAPSSPEISGFAYFDDLTPIRDQAGRGSCVAFAVASALEYSQRRMGQSDANLSEQLIYAIGKWDYREETFGDGLSIVDFLDEAIDEGEVLGEEDGWGYNPSWCRELDPLNVPFWYGESCAAYDGIACSDTVGQLDLLSNGNDSFFWHPDPEGVAAVQVSNMVELPIFADPGLMSMVLTAYLDAGFAVVAGMELDQDFMDIGSDGRMPSMDDTSVGGHAVQVVRFDLDPSAGGGGNVIIKNSWGCGWGDAGFAFLPLDWFASHAHSLVATRAVLAGGLNLPPSVSITTPDGTSQSVGPLGNPITLSATVADDHPGCCEVTWTSGIDGPLGTGNPLQVTLYGPGDRTIVATVRDAHGVLDEDFIHFTLTNDAPDPEILEPEWTPAPPNRLFGARVPVGAGVPFRGVALDPNDFDEVPCLQQSWSTQAQLSDLVTGYRGCAPVAKFNAAGWYQVRYEATDAFGWTGTDSMWVRAVEWGAHDLPWGEISVPAAEVAYLDPYTSITLTVETASGTGSTPTVQWFVERNGVDYSLGSGRTLPWTPEDDIPFSCGGSGGTLRAEVTDANGTTIDTREVWFTYPVC